MQRFQVGQGRIVGWATKREGRRLDAMHLGRAGAGGYLGGQAFAEREAPTHTAAGWGGGGGPGTPATPGCDQSASRAQQHAPPGGALGEPSRAPTLATVRDAPSKARS